MTLPDGAEFQNYVFLLQAHVTQKTANGEPVETDVEFTFLLRLESGLDLDLRLAWQTTSAPAEATCGANNTTTRTVKSDTLTDGLFQYSFDFLGESARTAEFVSADYRAGDGETGTLSQSGVLQMSPADGQDQETYFLSVTARASGQTVRYSFVLTYEDGLDLQLKFSWLERSVTRRDTLCAANGGASLTIKHNQLKDGLLQYQLALTGRSADKAAITSATLDSTTLSMEAGSIQLQSAEGGASYTIVVTAESGGKTITFKLLLRYQSDVSLKMTYSVLENDIERPRQLTCENGRTFTADVIRDDQLADGLLTYQFSIEGEEASDAIITNVEFLNGRGRSTSSTPSSPTASGTAALTLGHDNKTTGNNTFTITAKQGDTTYQFTFVLPYKHQGEQSVKIAVNNYTDGQEISVSADGGLELRPSIRAYRENADGTTSIIYASGLNGSQITVTLYRLDGGSRVQTFLPEASTGQGSDGSQEYVFHPTIPANAPGEDFEFELCIRAEDEEGNWGEQTLTLHAKRSEKGQKTGHTAQIYIDLGVLGLGTYGPVSYEILSGEPLSYVVAKVILNETVPAPFDKPCALLPGDWTGITEGSLDSGFYLAALNNGQLASSAKALSMDQLPNGWSTFSDDQAAFDYIDGRFGAGTNLPPLALPLQKPRPAQQRPILFRWLSRRVQLHRGIRLDVHHRPDNRLPRPQPLQRILHQQRQRRPHPPLYARLWLGRRRPHGRQGQRRRGLLHHLGIRRLGRPRPQLLRRARCGRKLRLHQLRRSLLHELHPHRPARMACPGRRRTPYGILYLLQAAGHRRAGIARENLHRQCRRPDPYHQMHQMPLRIRAAGRAPLAHRRRACAAGHLYRACHPHARM